MRNKTKQEELRANIRFSHDKHYISKDYGDYIKDKDIDAAIDDTIDLINKQVLAALAEVKESRDTHNADTGCDDEVLYVPYSVIEEVEKRYKQ